MTENVKQLQEQVRQLQQRVRQLRQERHDSGSGQDAPEPLPSPEDQEILDEIALFEKALPNLLQTHAGLFVAFRKGEVIKESADELALAEWVERNHRHDTVLIRRVTQDVIVDCLNSPEVELP